jgi:hypothetical protein
MGDADVLGIAKRAAGDFLGHFRRMSKLAAIAEMKLLRQTNWSRSHVFPRYETVPVTVVVCQIPASAKAGVTINLHYVGGCSSRDRAMAECKRSTS